MTDPLPATADELDAAWLTAALADRYPGARVRSVEVLERHEVTNAHARLRLTYDEQAGAPTEVFAKLPPGDDRREAIKRSGMGQREALFYRELAPTVAMLVPTPHVARHDDDDGSFVILLEDLVTTGGRVSDGTWGVAPDAAAVALEELADLHLRFVDPARRAAEVPWVPEARHGSDYGSVMLRYGLDNHRDRLSDQFAEIAEIYIDHAVDLHRLWHAGPHTVIHGDPHIGNLYEQGGRTGFLDWGIINVSTPMRDVSYFLNMSMSIDDRRAHERDLIRHYLSVWSAGGGAGITFDQAWRAHRIHASYLVPACCQVVTFPERASERRRVFSEAFLARAEAALDDLEARAALATVGGL
jgi:aminoglycoside phosphotransferase (APT) family kinase protein